MYETDGPVCIMYWKNVSYRIYVKCKGSATCNEDKIIGLTTNLSSIIWPEKISDPNHKDRKDGLDYPTSFLREENKLPPNLKNNSTRPLYICLYALIVSYLDLWFWQNRNRKL